MKYTENNVHGSTNDTRPWVVAFRNDWHKITPEITKVAMTHSPAFQFWMAENWADLAYALALKPALLLFHQDMARANNISTSEFVSMIYTMAKMQPNCAPRVAVSIDTNCTPEFIKELKNIDIAGVVPSIASYGIEPSMTAIESLLAGKQYWPKAIIDEIAGTKKTVRAIDPCIHLTARQKQVMDLVCHRGLPNKVIANMLHITESTVKIHISAILKEYGVRNRTQLALAARESLHD